MIFIKSIIHSKIILILSFNYGIRSRRFQEPSINFSMVVNNSNNTLSENVLPQSSSSLTMSSSSSFTTPLVNLNFLIKLEQKNYLIWREQLIGIVTAYGLERIIDLTRSILSLVQFGTNLPNCLD